MVVFKNLDTDKNGKLSREELIQGFLKVSSKKSEQEIVKEVDKLLEDIDTNNSGEVDFTEFVVAAMKRDKMVTRQKLEQTFKSLDLDGDGYVTRQEFLKVIGGLNNDDELWEEVVNQCEVKNGVVSSKSNFRLLRKSSSN